MPSRKFRTPSGKWITVKRYLALHTAATFRNPDTPPCEHGHYGCAVWEGGPCSNELDAEDGFQTRPMEDGELAPYWWRTEP